MSDPHAPGRSDRSDDPARAIAVASEHGRVILEVAFATSRDAIIIFRARDELIVDVNDAWCRTTGYARDQVIGRDQRTLDIWRDPADSVRLAAYLEEHGSVDGFEFAFTRHAPDGSTEPGFAELRAQPVTVAGETYVVGVGRDVTHARRERDARERARRLEELGRLAGGVAHDFNNLLTIITSYAELLQADAAAGTANPDDAIAIRRAAEAAASLARRLVAFSRHQPVVPQRVDLGATVRAARRLLTPIIGERIALDLELAVGLPVVLADPGQVEQVLINLVANARDAIAGGARSGGAAGRIVIRTGFREVVLSDVRRVLGVEGVAGRYVTLAVEDNGRGIDEATLARVFEPFFTTKSTNEGTGLGLAVVHGIVRQAGGVVAIDSAVGLGTTFTTYWPEAAGAAGAAATGGDAAATGPATSGSAGQAAHILVVEDQAPVREIARRVLVRAGYSVSEARDGDEALAVIARSGEHFDLVLTDAVMPGMDGHALAGRLAMTRPELPVLMMSGYLDADAPLAALPNLRAAILPKPFTAGGLLDAVRAAIAGDVPVVGADG